jgi:hypothetical protein
VPSQALFLLNNEFIKEQTERLARRLIAASSDPARRVNLATELTWSRPSTPLEQENGTRYVAEYARRLAKIGLSGEHLEVESWASYARLLICANEFVYLD